MNYIYNIPLRTITSIHVQPGIMKADLGASNAYIKSIHTKYLQQQQVARHSHVATLPNNEKIQATIQGKLPIHKELSIDTLVYPKLNNESLISIG